MGIGNHKTVYFDKIERTNKLQTLLALANAALNIKDKEEVKKQLEYSLNMFKEPKSETELGAGSYKGEKLQWSSKYTLSRDLGLFEDSKKEIVLSNLGLKLANGFISAKYYMSTVMLNNIQIINGKVVHLLSSILNEMESRNIKILTKKDIININDFNLGGKDDNNYIGGLMDLLQSTYFFKNEDKKVLELSDKFNDIGMFKKLLNLEYINESAEIVEQKFSVQRQKEWCEYLGKENRLLDGMLVSDEDNNNLAKNKVNCKSLLEIKYEHNRIIFGAPGTGKSHSLEEDRKDFGDNYERVTFHANYSYGQFVGTYKPVPTKDSEGKDSITYEYVPGPFMRVLVAAMRSIKEGNPRPYLLIIEEINRANVASVFGEVFQLLDRKSGESEYEIETSQDMRKYLHTELGGEISEYRKIKIPSNMYIWATMNSADQGVFPMDTAFKRRWDFEYIDINDNEKGIEGIKVALGEDKHYVEWNELRKAINNILLNICRVNEDKLLGPYFISKSVLESDKDGFVVDNDKFIKTFKSKVIMYIYEDAAGRQHRNKVFSKCSPTATYSIVCSEFDRIGEGIFGEHMELKQYKTSKEEQVE